MAACIRQNGSFIHRNSALVYRSLWSVFSSHHQHRNKLPISTSYRKRLPQKASLFVFSLHKMLKFCVSCIKLLYAVSIMYQTFLLSWASKNCLLCLTLVAHLVGSQSPSRSQQKRDTEKKHSQVDLGQCFPHVPVTLYLKRYQLPVTKPYSPDLKQVCEYEYSNSYSDCIFVPVQINL